MRVLLDTDVVLDVVLARPAFVTEAAAIWLAHEQGRITAHMAAITPVNVFYIVRRARSLIEAREAVGELLHKLRACPVDDAVLQHASKLPMSDYEDAVQAAAAQAAGLDALVTRNGSDYAGAPLLVLSPGELLARLTPPSTDP